MAIDFGFIHINESTKIKNTQRKYEQIENNNKKKQIKEETKCFLFQHMSKFIIIFCCSFVSINKQRKHLTCLYVTVACTLYLVHMYSA